MKKYLLLLFIVSLVLVGCGSAEGNTEVNDTSSDNEEAIQDDFPTDTITLIVPYAPGGSTDTSTRIIAEGVSNYLPNNPNVIVENKPGGSSTVGLTQVYNAEPDGYTLGITMETGLAIKTHTDELQYEMDSFEEIIRLVASPQLLIIREDAPWENFQEWLEYVKENPGKFKYAHSGNGTIGHLAMEELAAAVDIDIVGIPYDGGGPSMQALLSGEVGGTIGNPYQVDPELNRILVDTGSEPSNLYEATTLKEEGIDVGNTPWIGLVGPPDIPEKRLQIIHDAFKQVLEDSEVKEKLIEQGLPPYYAGADEFRDVIKQRYDINGKILKEIGMAD
ncbi:tripartite tricarboxylate transporter substrate binding protein [Oceanobacillus damuensis]|uniref:tripartite tricarboxylate transporter substrate binding protein n=1 Tax=Oceanobacillus damuensis TaxID=937928 RepID=UPI000831EB51|nr:tripartite tricarboxylate transporter substrate binding protein [Oceanobacillus damuensis]